MGIVCTLDQLHFISLEQVQLVHGLIATKMTKVHLLLTEKTEETDY